MINKRPSEKQNRLIYQEMIYRNNILITVNFFTLASKKDKMKKSIEKDCYSLNIRREK